METNKEAELARRLIIETGKSVFLTGKAGTGKTTFLRKLVTEAPKRLIVLAPTGIAAINAGGMTIHSFFQLPFAPFVPGSSFGGDAKYRYQFGREKLNLMRSIDLLVIDEISMVRADLLDAVDDVLRRFRRHDKPFGGVQLLLIGDMQQLPPVVKDEDWKLLSPYYDSPYFFSSNALKQAGYVTIELHQVYRQRDEQFLQLLSNIREHTDCEETLRMLNSRCVRNFDPPQSEGYIRLTTHNRQAHQINDQKLSRIASEAFTYKAVITGQFPEYSYPTDTELVLKTGAQVMFVKNDISGRQRFVNGTIGEVAGLSASRIQVCLKDSAEVIDVEPMEWTNARYKIDAQTQEIVEEIEGVFKQYPLKLAWAITIHKSQGLTFDRAIIDSSAAFAHGQTYVALSRCRTLEGIVLSEPIPLRALVFDHVVQDFLEHRQQMPDAGMCRAMEQAYYQELLHDLYGFSSLSQFLRTFIRVLDEHLYQLYPKQLALYKAEYDRIQNQLSPVAVKFEKQYLPVLQQTDYKNNPWLKERLQQAAVYFAEQLRVTEELLTTTHVESDNKVIQKKLSETFGNLVSHVKIKKALFEHVANTGFDVCDYLKNKSVLSIESVKEPEKKSKRKAGKDSVPADIGNEELYRALVAWRREVAMEKGQPAYTIIQQKAILSICQMEPQTLKELAQVPYIGKVTHEKYGEDLIRLIGKHTKRLL